MCALISMAVWDTPENQRTPLTARTLASLCQTVDFNRHRCVVVDNNSCPETQALLAEYATRGQITLLRNRENMGTALAVNRGWRLRQPGEALLKIDNDVEIHEAGWLDTLEACLARDPQIGIIGLKRKDCPESPLRQDRYRSELKMLPHQPGERWLVVERVAHVTGTCQLYHPALIDRIGGLYQMDGLYGYDDALAAVRCLLAGFYSCFYPHIELEHLDSGVASWQQWKETYAREREQRYRETVLAMSTGRQSIWYPL
jgi:GT2 family glycosyltransferase